MQLECKDKDHVINRNPAPTQGCARTDLESFPSGVSGRAAFLRSFLSRSPFIFIFFGFYCLCISGYLSISTYLSPKGRSIFCDWVCWDLPTDASAIKLSAWEHASSAQVWWSILPSAHDFIPAMPDTAHSFHYRRREMFASERVFGGCMTDRRGGRHNLRVSKRALNASLHHVVKCMVRSLG